MNELDERPGSESVSRAIAVWNKLFKAIEKYSIRLDLMITPGSPSEGVNIHSK